MIKPLKPMPARMLLAAFLSITLAFPSFAKDFYWENPVFVSTSDSRFPTSASNGTTSALLWQEIQADGNKGEIWLSALVFNEGNLIRRDRFAGPFPYSGEVPSIASVAIDGNDTLLVSVSSAANTVAVLKSTNLGASFTEVKINGDTATALGPRIFATSSGEYLLFAARGSEDNFTLVFSRSPDGLSWSPWSVFSPAESMRRAFLPTHATLGDRDIIVFQAFQEGAGRSSFQLYSTVSLDAGRTWSQARLITAIDEVIETGQRITAENWHNQRAKLLAIGSTLSLVWERSRTSTEKYSIYHTILDPSGLVVGQSERVSSPDGYCFDPDIIEMDGNPAVVWFDNRRGVNRVYLALKEGFLWQEFELSQGNQESVFARILRNGDDTEVYWQQAQNRTGQRIVRLAPDASVQGASIAAQNFLPGGRGRISSVRTEIRLPQDSSGIAGYSWAWSYNERPIVPQMIMELPSSPRVSVEATSDGSWYLGVRVSDYAGNWSEPVYTEYFRDTTPPLPPSLANLERDSGGYLLSNTFDASWSLAEMDEIAGYSWNLEYLASLDYLPVLASSAGVREAKPVPASFDFASRAAARFKPALLPSRIRTARQSASFTNQDNGIYAFSVSAVDTVGNVSEPAVVYLALNKYVPYTFITYIDSKVDDTGVISLSMIGRGFSDGGLVNEVYLDRDGRAPWDVTLTRTGGRYRVFNDRLITDITLTDLEEGMYRIGLLHPARGLYLTKPLLNVDSFGTVKFGDYTYDYVPPWKVSEREALPFARPDTVLWYAVAFFAVGVFAFSLLGVQRAAVETIQIKREVQALLTGDIMPSEKKKRSKALRNKGVGLRFKLGFFTTTLVISVVLIVSIPLGIRFSANQERILAQGLESRVNVLLDSLASGARAYLPSQNVLELGFLPAQMTALSEAVSATITGSGAGNTVTGIDFIWATNAPDIEARIDTSDFKPGQSRIVGAENRIIEEIVKQLDLEAVAAVSELSTGISALTQEGIKLALNTDAASVQRRDEIQTITRQLEEKLNAELSRLAREGTGSYPEYNPVSLSRDIRTYVFFKPVMYRRGGDASFVHGTVRVEISTDSLIETVDSDRRALVETTVYTALLAVLIGVAGALVLASIIISPVRKLASHVAMIRDTEDKEDLIGKELKLRSKDEIGLLGETINEMAHGLVKAAAASKDLTVGKEVQKMFIPLETDSSGRKLTCGSSSDSHAEFFGYYEGAKGVSGDYFDYIKLDDRHYAIIKCDVAGKGVPAALIMVEVATLFLDYFKDWKYEKNGYKLDVFVSRINDLIESRGFKGRFAAFTLLILDAVSGDAYFCNAGDNLIHVYESSRKKMKTVTLPETSAAGVFPTFLVDMKGGFKVSKFHLSSGDVLFLYTDGIEEAKRLFRDKNLKVFTCAEPGLESEAPHGTHSVGQDNEELGPERVNAIIESVFAKRPFILEKWHDHETNLAYEFDFTRCDGTIEEAILALVSVEKIFRMYRDPAATDFDRVQVDRKVDLFLNKHFRQYGEFCANRRDHPEYGEYLQYTKVREDDQYDDLTLLCVKKK